MPLLVTAQQQTDNQLKTTVNGIRNETVQKAITKERLSDFLDNLIDSKYSRENIAEIVSDLNTELGGIGWQTKLTQEEVEDIVGGLATSGTAITATYDDAAGELSFSVNYSILDQRYYTESELDVIHGQQVPKSRTLGINGEVYDLSQDRNWTIDISPSGDSRFDQSFRSPQMYEDASLLGFSVGSNTQTTEGGGYRTLDETGKSLAQLKSLFPDVPEVIAADSITDFAYQGTGLGRDSIGVSVDYAVVYQMLQDDYNMFIPGQTTLMLTNQVVGKEGSFILGAVARRDLNGSRFVKVNNCNCNALVNKEYVQKAGQWHLGGRWDNFAIIGNKENNSVGSGIVVENWGETFIINSVHSNENNAHGIYAVGKVAPMNLLYPSLHRNDSTGFMARGTRGENSPKEIMIIGPTGDGNTEGLIAIDMPYTSLKVLNIKIEGDQKWGVNCMNCSGGKISIDGGGISAYDQFIPGNGPSLLAFVRVDYQSGDGGFFNPSVHIENVVNNDYPNGLYDAVQDKYFPLIGNEYGNDMKYTRWSKQLMPTSQLVYGMAFYGDFEFTSPGNSMVFHNNGLYHHVSTNTLYINNYSSWNPGTEKVVVVKAASEPSISIQGTHSGSTSKLRTVGSFVANEPQAWHIMYYGVIDGEAVYVARRF